MQGGLVSSLRSDEGGGATAENSCIIRAKCLFLAEILIKIMVNAMQWRRYANQIRREKQ